MALLILVLVLGLVFLVFGICFICKAKDSLPVFGGCFMCVLGLCLVLVVTFVAAPIDMPSGLPKTKIANGTYEVAFVYINEEKVNVGVQKEAKLLYLYQFPVTAFDGKPNLEAKKMTIIESGGFRKIVLE